MEKRLARFCKAMPPKHVIAICRAYNLGMLKLVEEILTHYGF